MSARRKAADGNVYKDVTHTFCAQGGCKSVGSTCMRVKVLTNSLPACIRKRSITMLASVESHAVMYDDSNDFVLQETFSVLLGIRSASLIATIVPPDPPECMYTTHYSS